MKFKNKLFEFAKLLFNRPRELLYKNTFIVSTAELSKAVTFTKI